MTTEELTSEQREKISAIKRYIETVKDLDCLHAVVIILGVCFFGSIIGRRPETVWRRVKNPGQFRYHEMESLSLLFDISVPQIMDLIEKQRKYNELLKADESLVRRIPYIGKNERSSKL